MKYKTSEQIRRDFLDFFIEKNHYELPSSSLIPVNDPTLLWINSGVAALKKFFDGTTTPPYKRICNSQKAIRTNDIEEVGVTSRHHTFFEMLGYFSIGDYFKKDAVAFAWEFLTEEKWLGIDKDLIYISVHPDDHETYDLWVKEHGVNPNHILKTEDNFWEIGEGPSGPNSEIFIDRGPSYDPENIGERLFFEETENDRYVEIWNLVFSQYNAKPGIPRSEYQELPQKNIDTGMGFERVVSILQNGETNYDTDLFLPIINEIEKLAKVKYQENKMSYRIIADHLRTITFAVADGAAFSNEKRGYVLRRLLRRAYRHGKKIGINNLFLYTLVPTVAKIMECYYPYLNNRIDYVQKLIKIEEQRFEATLADGEKLLNQMFDNSKDKKLSGEDAFKLYDTYGFPLELTVEIVDELKGTVDIEGYEKEMEKQKERARSSRTDFESMSDQSGALLEFKENSVYLYEEKDINAKIIGIYQNGKMVDNIQETSEDSIIELIFDQTNFYAESGGQISDEGYIEVNGMQIPVISVRKAPHGQHLHRVETNGLNIGDEVKLIIDWNKRKLIKRNHTSLHLLQQALKDVLGDHISQAGSFVASDYARFDFTHHEKVSDKQLLQIENLINQKISDSLPINASIMSMKEAQELGAIALFGDKYGDEVRVINVDNYSVELCGGCHVNNTAEIGIFKIQFEESIGSGIRRLQVTTGINVYYEYQQRLQTIKKAANLLKSTTIEEITDKINSLNNSLGLANDQINKANQYLGSEISNRLKEKIINKDGYDLLITKVNIPSFMIESASKLLRMMIDDFKAVENKVGVFIFENIVLIGVSSNLVDRFHSGKIAKEINNKLGGKGGGNQTFAQVIVNDLDKIENVEAEIEAIISGIN